MLFFSINIHENTDVVIAQLKNIYFHFRNIDFGIIYNTNESFNTKIKSDERFQKLVKKLESVGKQVIFNPKMFSKSRFHGSILRGILTNLYYLLDNKIEFSYFFVLSSKNLFSNKIDLESIKGLVNKNSEAYEKDENMRIYKKLTKWHWPRFYQTIPKFLEICERKNWCLKAVAHEGMILPFETCLKMKDFLFTENLFEYICNARANVEESVTYTLGYGVSKGKVASVGSCFFGHNKKTCLDKMYDRDMSDKVVQSHKDSYSWENIDELWSPKGGDFILHHFGDMCYPFIIINHCLSRGRKTLFELGKFKFNSNVKILSEGDFTKITDQKYLHLGKNKNSPKLERFENVLKKYGHDNEVYNSYYDITLNHDFIVESGVVKNYNHVVESFKKKVSNFIEDIESGKPMIFINFSDDYQNHKFRELEDILKNKYKIGKFLIMVYIWKGDLKHTLAELEKMIEGTSNIKFIITEKSYYRDWLMSKTDRKMVYGEIYEKFREILISWDKRAETFPLYKDTAFMQL